MELKFTDSLGRKVELTTPMGNGGGGYHIYIDRYYLGQIIKRQGQWQAFSQNNGKGSRERSLDGGDLMVLASMVTNLEEGERCVEFNIMKINQINGVHQLDYAMVPGAIEEII